MTNIEFRAIADCFKTGRDAAATNRGFYYQYLVILKKWIENFINGNNSILYTEVDEDIKEVGDILIFTQVKSYCKKFSLQSDEINRTLFNFFLTFLENMAHQPQFVFHTNTAVGKNEKLLSEWIKDPSLKNIELRDRCVKKLRELLAKGFRSKKNRLLSKGLTAENKAKLYAAEAECQALLHSEELSVLFTTSIKWEFLANDPGIAVIQTEKEVLKLLEHAVFQNHSPFILLNTLLSEIYRASSRKERDQRQLTLELLQSLLGLSESELESCLNRKFIHLIGNHSLIIRAELEKVRIQTEKNSQDIFELKSLSKGGVNPPKRLNFIPSTPYLVGRAQDLHSIRQLLYDENMCLVTGIGGMGKSALCKAFINRYEDEFDYLIWLDGQNGIILEVVSDGVLHANVGISFDSSMTSQDRFDNAINKLNKLMGKKLILIDGLSGNTAFGDIKLLEKLDSQFCKVVVTTRYQIPGKPVHVVNPLSFESCVDLVIQYCKKPHSKSILKRFFELVGYNTLIIELCSKLISKSLDLTFEQICDYFENNLLNSEDLEIDILSHDFENTQLYSHLLNTFKLSDLTDFEKFMLLELSLLPATFQIDDYISCYGKEHYATNKIKITNVINSLHNKGWVIRDGVVVRMHNFVQNILRYESVNPLAHVLFINYLCHRLNESNMAFSVARFRYMKFADSILENIPESKRDSIRQPLLLLENNVLEAHRQSGNYQGVYDSMKSLCTRAEKYLSKDDRELGVFYYNMAGAYFHNREIDLAVHYFEKAIKILSSTRPKNYSELIKALDGLAHALMEKGPERAKDVLKLFKKLVLLRKKYVSVEDPLLALQLNGTALFYQKLGMFKEAIDTLEFAIEMQKSVSPTQRVYFVATYESNISYCYCIIKDYLKALKHSLKSAELFESVEGIDPNKKRTVYAMLNIIYRELGDENKAFFYLKKATNC